VIELTGTLTSNVALVFPAGTPGHWIIVNNTTGAYSVSANISGQVATFLVPQGNQRSFGNDGTLLFSPLAQAFTLATPSTTVTGNLPAWGGISGQSLTDSGVSIGTGGHSLCPLDSSTPCAFAVAPTVGGAPLGGGAAGSMIINGDMDGDQRFYGAANGTGIDRWIYAFNQGSGLSLQRVIDAPALYGHSLKALASSTPVTLAASDIRTLTTKLEGSQVQQLAYGGSAAQTATLTGIVKCTVAGNYAFSIRNSTPNYSYVDTFSVTTVNAWTTFQKTIPAPPVGSPWSPFTDNQYAMSVSFDLGSGANFSTTTPAQWQSGNFVTTTGATGLVTTASASCQFTGIHLVAGTNPGTYVPRPYPQELALMQRYYRKTFNESVAPAQNAGLAGALCARAPSAGSYVSAFLPLPSGLYTGVGSSSTVTLYNPSAANASWRDVTAASDVAMTIDPATSKGGTGVFVTSASTIATAGDVVCGHAVFDSGF
jgi:hypothetical protein